MKDKPTYEILDGVTAPEDIPGTDVKAGDVGTIVEMFGHDQFLVDFVDSEGYSTMVDMVSDPELGVVGIF